MDKVSQLLLSHFGCCPQFLNFSFHCIIPNMKLTSGEANFMLLQCVMFVKRLMK